MEDYLDQIDGMNEWWKSDTPETLKNSYQKMVDSGMEPKEAFTIIENLIEIYLLLKY